MNKSMKIIKNNFFIRYIILILIFNSLEASDNINQNELLKTAEKLENINKMDDALKIYKKLFNINQSNQFYFQKIKKILLEKKLYEQSIVIYEQYIKNIDPSKDKFLIEMELL